MSCALVNLVLFLGDVHADEGDGAAAAAGGSFEAGNDFAVLKASEEARCRRQPAATKANLFWHDESEKLGLDRGTEDSALSFLHTAASNQWANHNRMKEGEGGRGGRRERGKRRRT
jgi:hypothetical protein